jgi:hypothetical protein
MHEDKFRANMPKHFRILKSRPVDGSFSFNEKNPIYYVKSL